MSECETVRVLRVELEEERARNEATKKDIEEILEDRIEAIGGRSIALAKLATFEVVLGNVRSELERVTKERDALREEIARRDAGKQETALSWIEKTDARLEKMERNIEDIINRREKGVAWAEKTLLRLEKIEARQDSYMDLEKRLDSLATSISSRLDGPTGVDKRIVAVEAGLQDGIVSVQGWTDKRLVCMGLRLAKLEARVSKKRVKK